MPEETVRPGPRPWGTVIKCAAAGVVALGAAQRMFALPGWLAVPAFFAELVLVCLGAEGFYRSGRRGRYTLLLFAGFAAVGVLNALCGLGLPLAGADMKSNLLGVLLLLAVYMLLIEKIRAGKKERRPGQIVWAGTLIFLTTLGAAVVASLSDGLPFPAFGYAARLIPSFAVHAYALPLVLLGVLFYCLRPRKWMEKLVLALNGEPRRGGRLDRVLLFVFYPAQAYVLYLAAWLLQR